MPKAWNDKKKKQCIETNIILMWKITIFIFNSKLQFDGCYKIWDQAETNTSFFSDLSVLVNSEVFISRIKKEKSGG